jgi:hypothetical protein
MGYLPTEIDTGKCSLHVFFWLCNLCSSLLPAIQALLETIHSCWWERSYNNENNKHL